MALNALVLIFATIRKKYGNERIKAQEPVLLYKMKIFTTRYSYASTVLGVVMLSIRLSHACFVTKPNNALWIV